MFGEYFSKFGITPDRILAVLGKPSVNDLEVKDLETLVGISTAIKDGDIDIDQAFPPILKDAGKATTLQEKVKAKREEIEKKEARLPGMEG